MVGSVDLDSRGDEGGLREALIGILQDKCLFFKGRQPRIGTDMEISTDEKETDVNRAISEQN